MRNLILPVVICLCAAPTVAQCQPQFAPGGPVPGVDRRVHAVAVWGSPQQVVVGGDFWVAGTAATYGIAGWQPTTGTWSSFGNGVNGKVLDALTLPGGDLVISGEFVGVSGVAANNIARWNGNNWSPVGGGTDGSVHALTTMPNGDIIAVGSFSMAGGVPANNVARWDGSTWSALGAGLVGNPLTVLVDPNGDVIVGGQNILSFTGAARWNGVSWTTLGQTFGFIADLEIAPGGTLVAAGSHGSSASGVRTWNGTAWTPLGNWSGTGTALTVTSSGHLLASGSEQTAIWNGASWSLFGHMRFATDFAELANGDIIAVGQFLAFDDSRANGIARWNGFNWSRLNDGTNDAVSVLRETADGSVLAGGKFTSIEGTAASRIARWDGTSWSALGFGVNGPVLDIAELPNGDIVAIGTFDLAGGAAAPGVARWDGAAWTPMGAGLTPLHLGRSSLAVDQAGDLFLGCRGVTPNESPILRWDGTAWTPVGTVNGRVDVVIRNPGHGITIAGNFQLGNQTTYESVARWDGVTWTGLNATPASNEVFDIVYLPDGDIVASGYSSTFPPHGIARYDGATWQPVGSSLGGGVTKCLEVLPSGDLLAGGDFFMANGTIVNRIARFDGATWTPLGTGMELGGVETILTRSTPEVMVGGEFVLADGLVSARLARLHTPCPAAVVPLGAGCTAPNNMPMTTTQLPWIGGTFAATVAGVQANSIGVGVFGLTTTLQTLPSLLPQGVPGCLLLVTPDVMATIVPTQGTLRTSLPLPHTATLVGATVHHQAIVLGLAGGGAITTVTATDAVSFTIGQF